MLIDISFLTPQISNFFFFHFRLFILILSILHMNRNQIEFRWLTIVLAIEQWFPVYTRMAYTISIQYWEEKEKKHTYDSWTIDPGMHRKIVCFANFSSRFFASAAFCRTSAYPVYRIVSNLVRLIVKTSQTSRPRS